MAVSTYDYDAVLAAFFSSALFLIGYSLIAKWWQHPIGRALAFLDAGLVITLAPSALHQILGFNLQDIFYAWYYGSSLWLVSAITLWRLAIIARIQRSATPRRRLASAPEPPPSPVESMGD